METGREGGLLDAGEAVWAGWSGADLGVDYLVQVLLSWTRVTSDSLVTEKKQALLVSTPSTTLFIHYHVWAFVSFLSQPSSLLTMSDDSYPSQHPCLHCLMIPFPGNILSKDSLLKLSDHLFPNLQPNLNCLMIPPNIHTYIA